MTKSATEQAPRPWWRRLLCWLGLALGGLLALGVLLIVIVVAINWRDEALSPAAQAWLTEPANTVADADNAWLAMLAISYEHGNATTTGRKLVDTLRSNPRALEDEATTRQFGPRWSNQEISAEDCSIRRKGPGLLGRLLADPTAASVLVAAQRPALDRYYHAIALPGYHEIQLGDPLPSLITFKASCLARRDISLRLKNGDPTAIPLLEQHLHYWVTATTQSQSLLSLMIANAQMQADIDWLQDLRKAYPSRLPLPLKKIQKEYAEFANQPHQTLMEEPIKGEFRLVANQLSGIFLERSQGPDEDTSWYKGLTERLLYQHNATLNLAQRSMAGFLAGSESPPDDCEIVQMHLVYNPVGKVLACIATPSYEEYFERLRTTQAATGELAASLH